MVTIGFLVYNKSNRIKFFKKIFLLANIDIKIVLKMFFLFFSNVKVKFIKVKKTYLKDIYYYRGHTHNVKS